MGANQLDPILGPCGPYDPDTPMSLILNPYSFQPVSAIPEILWWKMNDGSGTSILADVGPNGTTDASWLTGKSGAGYALDFNGTTHEASSNAALTYSVNIITVCFWLWLDNRTATQVVLESSADYNSNASAWNCNIFSSLLRFGVRGDTGFRTESITAPNTGEWNHYAAVLNNSTATGDVKIYANGSLQSETISVNTKTGTANFAGYTLYAGARGGSSLRTDARIDDLRIYNRELSVAEITAVVNDPQ